MARQSPLRTAHHPARPMTSCARLKQLAEELWRLRRMPPTPKPSGWRLRKLSGPSEGLIAFYETALKPLGIVHALDYDGKNGPEGIPTSRASDGTAAYSSGSGKAMPT